MKSALQAPAPPARPLMIFDGDCNFCRLWIRRWQNTTGERVDFIPLQDPGLAERFPELRREDCEKAVHLVEPSGSIYYGAEAAFRALATNPDVQWPLEWYERWPAFAGLSEWSYRQIARHRPFFSFLTRLAWGRHPEPSTFFTGRWIFLRMLALIYFIAFVSLGTQILGLVGARGIVPAKLTMSGAREALSMGKLGGTTRFPQATSGLERFHLVPTFCWLDASDGFLKFHCTAGAILAILLFFGVAPAPCLFLMWLIYLSLSTVCREFLGFQWDNLLLEAGFLAIILAPLQLRPSIRNAAAPSRIALWLLRWLLFRLMFESGCVKLLSGDPTWRNLTALNFHYETQPLPTWLGWYAHQMPAWFQMTSVLLMFTVELAVPFLIFAPRRPRHLAALLLIALQVVILLTGNYCFFNLLTIAFCTLLFDDHAFRRKTNQNPPVPDTSPDPPQAAPAPAEPHRAPSQRRFTWPKFVTVPALCLVLTLSLMQLTSVFGWNVPWPATLAYVYQWAAPWRSVNNYGLFAVMTTSRPEIVFEGSDDGIIWREYDFKYKPGDLQLRPRFVAPHQPRLDWQMWFAALGRYQQNPWLVYFGYRLLDGSPEVLGLLDRNPFPARAPRYVRAILYDYHFTDRKTRRRTGAWWRREPRSVYLPPISLRDKGM